ncbi:ParA family protein [Fusobacterium ulcerans]|uniref:ParA family protein n=1 Tax=Fusobacterium ulcerans TaxID=861 RepID=UPI001D0AF207|nr:ParA family protein [Fusobacterium ulcerans]MCB8564506.1 ParA family protein [Fusobacterium ulcerans]MCB8648677.1 ParA family protein [Fusobacterium ulcerans]
MWKKIRVTIQYKKDRRLNYARINLGKDYVETLKLNPEEKEVLLEYKDGIITIEKFENTTREEVRTLDKERLKYLKTVVKLSYEEKRNNYKMLIPLPIVAEMELEKNNFVEIKIENNQIIMQGVDMNKKGKMIVVKVNKGGIGKTFLSVQLAHGLSLLGKKVLLLTSDSQNNILEYTCKDGQVPEFEDGLKEFVKGGKGEIIKLRNNMFFIPLENNKFGSQFLNELPIFLEKMKEEYDFVIVDSIPTMKLDSTFVACAEKIIIPCFADRVTVDGALNVIDEAGIDKVLAIIVNLYRNTAVQNTYLEKLKSAVKGTNIIFPEPIKELSQIETLLEKGKTIWESEAKVIKEVQNSLLEILTSSEIE